MDMKKIKLSPFWLAVLAAIGVLLFALVPVIFTMIADKKRKNTELRLLAGRLKDAKEGTPSKQDIESWQKYRAEVVRHYGDVTKFYTDSDKILERWFTNLHVDANGVPARDAFMTQYNDEAQQLESKLGQKPHEVKFGSSEENQAGQRAKGGFNWEMLTPADWNLIAAGGEADETHVLRELQKRYWARQRLANTILNGGVKVNRIVDFRFFKKLHDKLGSAFWEQYPTKQEDVIHWQGVNAGMTGQPIGFVETDLPNELGKTLTFGFAIELPYSEVPKAIREMLNPGNQPAAQEPMLVNLIGTHVTIREQNEPVVTYNFILNDDADKAAKHADALRKAGGDKARPVLLAVTCQIIDFEPAKVKKFEKGSN
jgi:hypothetical protein